MQTKETVIKASLGWLQLRQLSNTWKYVLYFLVQKQYALFKGKFGTLCFVFNFSVFCLKACYALFSSKYVSCNQWYLLLQEVNRECNGNFYDPTSDNCSSELSKVDELKWIWNPLMILAIFKLFDEINIYNILEPCYHGTEAEKIIESYIRMPSSFQKLGKTKRPFHVRKKMLGCAWPLRAPVRDGIVPTWPQLMNRKSAPPCTVGCITTI